jgi:hypothetical protein
MSNEKRFVKLELKAGILNSPSGSTSFIRVTKSGVIYAVKSFKKVSR